VTLWISPALPDPLRASLEALAANSDTWVQIVTDRNLAAVRAGPSPEVPLATWIYAVVAPFPTVEDSISSSDLQAAWRGSGTIYASAAASAALEGAWGPAGAGAVIAVPPESLLSEVWERRPAMAIVPFEALEPRWKVIAVDGLSPVRNDFEAEGYSLAIPFGLSGDPTAVSWVQYLLDTSEGGRLAWPATNRDPARLTVVLMTGVTALARATAAMMESNGIDYPGQLIADWLRGADITHVSHEVSFATNCPEPDPFSRNLRMCGQPSHAALFDSVGVDVIELTGNHLLDWGPTAFLQTLDIYSSHGWLTFGGGSDLETAIQPALIEDHGNRFAFIGCNQPGPDWDWATDSHPGAAPCSDRRILASVTELRSQGYLPIFTYQWAERYLSLPLPAQMDDFRAAVGAGAVIVSGSQAHTPQTFEFYDGALIHYGLGNLFFDQMWSTATRQELLDRHVFYDGRYISTEILTAMLENYAQPRPMTAEERSSLLESIFAASGW
jgi:poly-gamma-glutamate synthesis protein (capsule biosynthesis protein)